MAKNEKKKRPPAHETAMKLLAEDKNGVYLSTFIRMYSLGTMVPVEAIPELIETLQETWNSISESTGPIMLFPKGMLNEAILELQDQLTEAEAKKDE